MRVHHILSVWSMVSRMSTNKYKSNWSYQTSHDKTIGVIQLCHSKPVANIYQNFMSVEINQTPTLACVQFQCICGR